MAKIAEIIVEKHLELDGVSYYKKTRKKAHGFNRGSVNGKK